MEFLSLLALGVVAYVWFVKPALRRAEWRREHPDWKEFE